MLGKLKRRNSTSSTILSKLFLFASMQEMFGFFRGFIGPGFILSDYTTVAGTNSLRIGHVEAVRLRYRKSGVVGGENEIVVQKVIVQQANVTIAAVE